MINDLLNKYYDSVISLVRSNKGKEFANFFLNNLGSGRRVFYQKNIVEEKKFDKEWIETLESFLPSIDKITKTPKSNLAYKSEVVDVAKARKINAESVRHLASHTHFIKDIDNRGNVTPNKVLTSFSEDDFVTYENRFIMTLVNRLVTFVEKRHKVIRDNVESFQKNHLYYSTDFKLEDTSVSVNLDITLKRDLDNAKINKDNYELLNRVEKLLEFVKGIKGSPFMSLLKKAKKVNPPIMKTNIILKNPDFRNAYTLWLFLDRYSTLGYDVKVKEKNIPLNKKLEKDLNNTVLFSYASFQANNELRREHFDNFDDYKETTKKSTKIAKTNPNDMIKEPDSIKMEDTTIYEYYLETYKKMFNKRFKDYLNEQDRYDLALKRALRETIDISNLLYDGLFNLKKEVDYFNRLVTTSDPAKDLDEAKKKAKIAKIIREIKEKDYQNFVKLERRLLSDIDDAHRKVLNDWKEKYRFEVIEKEKIKIKKKMNTITSKRDKIKENISVLDDKNNEIVMTKDELKEEINKVNSELKTKTKEFMEAEKANLKEEIKEMKKASKELAKNKKKTSLKAASKDVVSKDVASKDTASKDLAPEETSTDVLMDDTNNKVESMVNNSSDNNSIE